MRGSILACRSIRSVACRRPRASAPRPWRVFQEVVALERRAIAADPNIGSRFNLSISLDRVGGLQVDQRDLAGALKTYQEDLDLRRHLVAEEPGSAEMQDGLATALQEVGDVQTRLGNRSDAIKDCQEALSVSKALSSTAPTNADYVLQVADSEQCLAALPGSGVSWADVVTQLETAKAHGQLEPSYEQNLADAREKAAKEQGAPKH